MIRGVWAVGLKFRRVYRFLEILCSTGRFFPGTVSWKPLGWYPLNTYGT